MNIKTIIGPIFFVFFACRPVVPAYYTYDASDRDAGTTQRDTRVASDEGIPDHGVLDARDANDVNDIAEPDSVDVRDVDAGGDGVVVIQCHSDDDCRGIGHGQCMKPVCTTRGVCGLVPADNGAACDSDNVCLTNTVCQDGECTGDKIDCDDHNVCTLDTCDPQKGCLHQPNTRSCDDGNACTAVDFCQDGQCRGTNNQCECQTDRDCQKFESKDKCKGRLFCDHGVCSVDPTTVVHCDDMTALPCHVYECNPDTGKCEQVPAIDGTACDDHNLCTRTDICMNGRCTGIKPLDCNDNDACTTDTCDPQKGCVHTPLRGTACDDGDACTTGDVCTEHGCQGQAIPGCGCKSQPDPDAYCRDLFVRAGHSLCQASVICQKQTQPSNCVASIRDEPVICHTQEHHPCQIYACNPAKGVCEWLSLPEGRPCDDGNKCTYNDYCDMNGQCQSGQDKDCDDGDDCTVDSCDPQTGECNHEPVAACGDNGDGIDDLDAREPDDVIVTDASPMLDVPPTDASPPMDIVDDATSCATDQCLINGQCVDRGAHMQSHECLVCDPAVPYTWSQVQDGTPCGGLSPSGTVYFCYQGECTEYNDADNDGYPEDPSLPKCPTMEPNNRWCNDNCWNTYNPSQADQDGDTIGDACDPDGCGDSAEQCQPIVLDQNGACVQTELNDGSECADYQTHNYLCGKGECWEGMCQERDGCRAYASQDQDKVWDDANCLSTIGGNGYCRHYCQLTNAGPDNCMVAYARDGECRFADMGEGWPCFNTDGIAGECSRDPQTGNVSCALCHSSDPCLDMHYDAQGNCQVHENSLMTTGCDGMCYGGICMAASDEWSGKLAGYDGAVPLGISARVKGIDLVGYRPSGQQWKLFSCQLNPMDRLSGTGPCDPNTMQEIDLPARPTMGMVDRGLVMINQVGGIWADDSAIQPAWHLVTKGSLHQDENSGEWESSGLARNLDLRDNRYWVFWDDVWADDSRVGLVYGDGGFDDVIPYNFQLPMDMSFFAGVSDGPNAVFMLWDNGRAEPGLFVNKDMDFTMVATEDGYLSDGDVYPHSLVLLPEPGHAGSRVCVMLHKDSKVYLRCRSFDPSTRVWKSDSTDLLLPFTTALPNLVSIENAMATAQIRIAGGWMLFVASAWTTRQNNQELRFTIFELPPDLSLAKLIYDTETSIKTDNSSQHMVLSDIYYDRLDKALIAVGRTYGIAVTKAFYFQLRNGAH